MTLKLAALLLLIASASCAKIDRGDGAGVVGHTASGTDPRSLYPTDFRVGETAPWVKFEAGKEYRYHFESKAAHLDSALPKTGKVRPQTALEDLGVFPFAVLEGTLMLQCQCEKDHVKLFRVQLSDLREDCGPDVSRQGKTCEHLKEVSHKLGANPFWMSMNVRGEVVGISYHPADGAEVRGIKKNLVSEFATTTAEASDPATTRFTRRRTLRGVQLRTTYSIHPFTRHATTTKHVDGILIEKIKSALRRANRTAVPDAIDYQRNSWVYMLVGGVIEGVDQAPVPTRIVSLEEVQIDPKHVGAPHNKSRELWVLSRVELDLRGLDPTDVLEVCELPSSYAHEKEDPPLSLLQVDQRELGYEVDDNAEYEALLAGLVDTLPSAYLGDGQ